MNRTNIYLTAKQLETLKKLSVETGLSVAELVRRAIDLFLETKPK
jgi:predicted DNA-binding protein